MRVHAFHTMGTVASIRSHDPLLPACLEAVHQEFGERDEMFSLYREGSEATRVARGGLVLHEASREFRSAFRRANDWRLCTSGAFTAQRPDGVIDLSGIVKAEAIAAAEDVLRAHDVRDYLITVGGDGAAGGQATDSPISSENGGLRAWRASVVDPDDRGQVLFEVALSGRWSAIATSGSAERGNHIWRQPAPGGFRQVTVLAPDIVTADVLATAIIAGGQDALDEAVAGHDIDAFAIGVDDGWQMTGRLRAVALARAPRSIVGGRGSVGGRAS